MVKLIKLLWFVGLVLMPLTYLGLSQASYPENRKKDITVEYTNLPDGIILGNFSNQGYREQGSAQVDTANLQDFLNKYDGSTLVLDHSVSYYYYGVELDYYFVSNSTVFHQEVLFLSEAWEGKFMGGYYKPYKVTYLPNYKGVILHTKANTNIGSMVSIMWILLFLLMTTSHDWLVRLEEKNKKQHENQ